MPRRLSSLHRPGDLDRAGEQQQLLRQRGLARVGVRNDGKGAAAPGFGAQGRGGQGGLREMGERLCCGRRGSLYCAVGGMPGGRRRSCVAWPMRERVVKVLEQVSAATIIVVEGGVKTP